MFLDREPYIRLWRPTYRIFGPFIRSIKSLLFPPSELRNQTADQLVNLQDHIARVEANQQGFYATFEQLLSNLADRLLSSTLAGIDSRLRMLVTEAQLNAALAGVQSKLATLDQTTTQVTSMRTHLAGIDSRLQTLVTEAQLNAALAGVHAKLATLDHTTVQVASVQAHIITVEVEQRRLYSTLEQVLTTIMADRHITSALAAIDDHLLGLASERHIDKALAGLESQLADRNSAGLAAIDERIHTLITERQLGGILAEKQSQLAAQNAGQWAAIERLLVGFMANSNRTEASLSIAAGSASTLRDTAARRAAV